MSLVSAGNPENSGIICIQPNLIHISFFGAKVGISAFCIAARGSCIEMKATYMSSKLHDRQQSRWSWLSRKNILQTTNEFAPCISHFYKYVRGGISLVLPLSSQKKTRSLLRTLNMFVLPAFLILILSFFTFRIYLKHRKTLVDEVTPPTTSSVTPKDASQKTPISVNYHFTRRVSVLIQQAPPLLPHPSLPNNY